MLTFNKLNRPVWIYNLSSMIIWRTKEEEVQDAIILKKYTKYTLMFTEVNKENYIMINFKTFLMARYGK